MQIPKRVSLVSEVVAILKDGIRDGVWKNNLPAERLLSEQLRIGRPSLRNAIAVVQREGLLQVVHGKPTLIVPSAVRKATPCLQKTVGLILNIPIPQIPNMVFHALMDVRDTLHHAGFGSEIFIPPPVGGGRRRQTRALEEFIRVRSIFCCVLLGSQEEQQSWFYKRNIPAFVMGSCSPSVQLPSLDVDYFSVCRHAAGIFLSRGHRRVALIRPESKLAGFNAGEEGFLAALASTGHKHTEGTIISYRESPDDLVHQLDRHFNSTGKHPTGVIISAPSDLIVVVLFLSKRGIRIPEDVSIIARDSDYNTDLIRPRITHYVYPEQKYAQQLARHMLQFLHSGTIPAKRHLILSEFKEGDSVLHRDGEEEQSSDATLKHQK